MNAMGRLCKCTEGAGDFSPVSTAAVAACAVRSLACSSASLDPESQAMVGRFHLQSLRPVPAAGCQGDGKEQSELSPSRMEGWPGHTRPQACEPWAPPPQWGGKRVSGYCLNWYFSDYC